MLNLIPIIFRSVPKCLMLWSISWVQMKTGSEGEPACLKVDLMDRFWQVFSRIKCRVASTHFKISIMEFITNQKGGQSLPCSQYTHTPEYMWRYWGSASRTGSNLSNFCKQEILHYNFKRIKCPASFVHMLSEQILHKATVNEELLVLIMGLGS